MDNTQKMYQKCQKRVNQMVQVQTKCGKTFEGVIMQVDEMNVYMDMPLMEREGSEYEEHDERRPPYGYGPGYGGYGPGYGYGGYAPYGPPYGYGGYGIGRLILPLAALTAVSTLPYFW
ncbi:hypothetical protein G4V62_06130 [Bacillaceae bacterium SIJ1]|uniref:hypothetical protein n=1 Tax=Litoribacterium kuwaitense TaxID=1398745 RepID=UPI0013ECEEAA|nr:hypothetical protein [Litoribacterium kuwaitense]NGP44555.1 hypothetical protein [Litoribacterium kuwaitense]